jgi:acyl carrier protein
MTHTEIIQQITPVFRKVFNEPNLNLAPEHSAADFDKWDSINHVILMARIEKLLNIKIDTAELIQLHTVGDLVELIARKTK